MGEFISWSTNQKSRTEAALGEGSLPVSLGKEKKLLA